MTITKSITIDCHEVYASILASGTNAIVISIAPGNPSDPLQTVRIRNLNLNGTGGGTRSGLNGIRIVQAQMVFIEDVLATDFVQRGISDERNVDGRLNVTNTILRNNGGDGIGVSPSSGSARIDVALDRVTSAGNGTGMTFNNGPRVMINNSTSSNNLSSGIESTSSVGATTVNVNRSMISSNGVALLTAGTSMLRFSDTDIAFNATGFSGATLTFGTSRITGNLVVGTVPTHMGGSFDGGQI